MVARVTFSEFRSIPLEVPEDERKEHKRGEGVKGEGQKAVQVAVELRWS
jgi:hypothetical protein